MGRILATAEVGDMLVKQGLEPYISTPDQFAAILKKDMAKFAKLIKEANIKVEN
jgi:tripartite-type tricarboxylate transporter receptor subunit TctC